MIITYDPYIGTTVTDKQILSYLLANKDNNIIVGSSIIIDAARLLHARKLIRVEAFVFEEQRIIPDDKGRLAIWPNGFCVVQEDILHDLMGKESRKDRFIISQVSPS